MCTCQDFYGRKTAEYHSKTAKNNFFTEKKLKKERSIENIRNIASFEKWNSDANDTRQTK